MNALAPITKSTQAIKKVTRIGVENSNPDVLTSIYNEDTNIAIWQRALSEKLANAVDTLIKVNSLKPLELAVSPLDAYDKLTSALNTNNVNTAEINELCKDIALLVEMFCCLFDLKRAGLRLTLLDKPMCPRFHVDRIPCRLVTTYYGIATQWLAHEAADRSKLGA